jgi:hypothetical protein
MICSETRFLSQSQQVCNVWSLCVCVCACVFVCIRYVTVTCGPALPKPVYHLTGREGERERGREGERERGREGERERGERERRGREERGGWVLFEVSPRPLLDLAFHLGDRAHFLFHLACALKYACGIFH